MIAFDHKLIFFRADRRGMCLFFHIQTCMLVNWPRKWAVLHFYKNSKISQNVLQKSTNFQNDFLIFGRVKKFLCPSTSFLTPDFLSGDSRKAFNFMIAFDHKWIFLIICQEKCFSSTSKDLVYKKNIKGVLSNRTICY